ncbi:hypothetical protein AB0M79_22050 [Polymorphospora sp. NPDC051019]|uniref:hypothetical protein n=1 Tax=Polymorphospora sp. NPDC051019 TaxID=3155725 RepID=UPI003414CD5F
MTLHQRVGSFFSYRIVRLWRRAFDHWSEHPSIDLPLVATIVGVHLLIVYGVGIGNVLAWADSGQRTDVYAAGAGITALIAGFTGTAIAQYGSSSGPLISALRATHGREIRKNWLSITKWLMISAVLCITSMAIDGGSSPKGSNWLFEVAFALTIVKFARLIFLFELIMLSVDRQDHETLRVQRAQATTRQASRRARVPQDTGVAFDED